MSQDIDRLSENLILYLRRRFKNSRISYERPLEQLQGGFETQIFRFQLNGVDKELGGDLVLRLYPAFYGTGNAEWESRVQNVLAEAGYSVARAHHLCTDMSVLGGAFFIMEFVPGTPLIYAPMETMPRLLGRIHAELHRINPNYLIKSFSEQGIDEDMLFLDNRFHWLANKVGGYPWIGEAVDWLVENRPPEPEKLAVCHGDLHPLNILIEDGAVTGVLDWPGFLIADPVLDVANTIILATIPFKHLAPSLGLDVSTVDFEKFVEIYLEAYVSTTSLDLTNLGYYQVRRCVNALIEGAEGQVSWKHPSIVNHLIDYIKSVSGIHLVAPD